MERALGVFARWLPGVWLGMLLCLALIAAPSGFALLPAADAGKLVARLLVQEAYLSLAAGMVLLVHERLLARRSAQSGDSSQFSTGMLFALGAVFCTVLGYFVLQPMMVQARAGQGGWSFIQLHAASAVFFGLKLLLVALMSWRALRPGKPG